MFQILFLISVFSVISDAQNAKALYRPDYQYIEATDSFYKIHTIGKTWLEARRKCVSEGSTLFYPKDEAEVHGVLKFWNDTQPFKFVFIGGSATLADGVYDTLDGEPVLGVYNKWAPGEPSGKHHRGCMVLRQDGTLSDEDCTQKNPFICKKTLSSVDWDIVCDMPSLGYKLDNTTGNCYKFHSEPQEWSSAYAICRQELSHLAVIDTETEAKILVNISLKFNPLRLQNISSSIHLGFHNYYDEGWMTIKGVPLSLSGYDNWSYGRPYFRANKCGTMTYDGELVEVSCDSRCAFICEHQKETTVQN